MRIFRQLLAVFVTLLVGTIAMAQDRPRVIAVNYPLQYFADRLLGDTADVVFPAPQGVDPSFWRPTIADITMIQSADLILLNGAGFATWVDRVSLPRSKVVNTTAQIEDQFIITKSITHSHGEGEVHSHEGLASYVWLDTSLAMAQAQAVAAAITARGLGDADEVETRLEALEADLRALDAQARSKLADLAGVPIVTTHPRYQYVARRYGLSLDSLEWDEGVMPNDAEIGTLKDLIAETGAGVMIWEAQPPAAAFELTTGLGLRNIVFETLAHGVEGQSFVEVFAEALSALADAGVQ